MNEPHVHATKQIDLHVDNILQFRLSKIKKIEEFFIPEIDDRENMSEAINKYILLLDMLTKLYLFRQVQAVVFLFSHLLLSLVHLLRQQVLVLV